MDSRVKSTRVVGEAIANSTNPPKIWLQSSTATIYAHRFDAPNDEETGIIGGNEPDAPETWRFSIDVAKAWDRTSTALTAYMDCERSFNLDHTQTERNVAQSACGDEGKELHNAESYLAGALANAQACSW